MYNKMHNMLKKKKKKNTIPDDEIELLQNISNEIHKQFRLLENHAFRPILLPQMCF